MKTIKKLLLAFLSLALTIIVRGNLVEAASNPGENLYYPGYDDSAYYRIPALARTKNGTMIAGIDQRHTTEADRGNIDAIVRLREPGQITFADPIKVIDLKEEDSTNEHGSAFVIDMVLLPANDGRVHMIIDVFKQGVDYWKSEKVSGYQKIDGKDYLELIDANGTLYTIREGVVYDENNNPTGYTVTTKDSQPFRNLGDLYKNGQYVSNIYLNNSPLSVRNTPFIWYTYSDDNGKNWAQPIDITPQIKHPNMYFMGTGPGRGLQLSNGRLIFPMYFSTKNYYGDSNSRVQATTFIYSDDNGQTWKRSSTDPADYGFNKAIEGRLSKENSENQLVELNDGKVVTFMRTPNGKKVLYQISNDKGTNWAGPLKEVDFDSDPSSNLSVVHVNKNGKEYVLLSNPSTYRRLNGSIKTLQVVGGEKLFQTIKETPINETVFEYSSMELVDESTVGVLYEDKENVNGKDLMHIKYKEYKLDDLLVPDPDKEPEPETIYNTLDTKVNIDKKANQNIAKNGKAFASFTNDPPGSNDKVTSLNDGIIDYPGSGGSNRWTTWQRIPLEGNQYIGIIFDENRTDEKTVNGITFHFYEDNGTKMPGKIAIQYYKGADIPAISNYAHLRGAKTHPFNDHKNWEYVKNVKGSPFVANGANDITFDEVSTKALRVVMLPQTGKSIAVTELEVWGKDKKNSVTPDPTDNQIEVTDGYEIYPKVKSIKYLDGTINLSNGVNLVLGQGLDQYTTAKARKVLEENKISFTESSANTGKVNLLVGINDSNDLADIFVKENIEAADIYNNYDAYRLVIKDNTIAVVGRDTDAAFYGLVSLQHILGQAQGNVRHLVINDYASAKSRGVIEGYYGNPWGWDNRISNLEFGGQFKSNIFVFAPKDDPYHNTQWRELYPESELKEIARVAKAGNENKNRFVWTIHPFMNNPITRRTIDEDIEILLAKFDQLYGAGVRQFGILADDIDIYTIASNRNEAYGVVIDVVNAVSDWAKEKGDVYDIIFCPTAYTLSWNWNATELNAYDQNFPENVQIITTGRSTMSVINEPDLQEFKTRGTTIPRRNPLFWLNWPVNDIDNGSGFRRVYIGPMHMVKNNVKSLVGAMTNPMEHAQLSQLAIFALSDYTWNIEGFDAQQSWEDSFKYVEPTAAKELRDFAVHNTHSGDTGYHQPESEDLAPLIKNLEDAITTKDDAKIITAGEALKKEYQKIAENVDAYNQKASNKAIKEELEPYTASMKYTALAGVHYIEAQIAKARGNNEEFAASFAKGEEAWDKNLAQRFDSRGKKYPIRTGSKRIRPNIEFLRANTNPPINVSYLVKNEVATIDKEKNVIVSEQREGFAYPKAFASLTNNTTDSTDKADQLNDGIIGYINNQEPRNRWTTYANPAVKGEQYAGIIFGTEVAKKEKVSGITLHGFETSLTKMPGKFSVQYYVGTYADGIKDYNNLSNQATVDFTNNNNWKEVTNLKGLPLKAGQGNDFSFDEVDTLAIRVVMLPQEGKSIGLTELVVWGAGRTTKETPYHTLRTPAQIDKNKYSVISKDTDKDYPVAFASFTNDPSGSNDKVEKLNDGIIDYSGGLGNRWTTWQKTAIKGSQYIGVIFGDDEIKDFDVAGVTFHLFEDHGVKKPEKIKIQYYKGKDIPDIENYAHLAEQADHPFNNDDNWEDVKNIKGSPLELNKANDVSFDQVRTKAIRVLMLPPADKSLAISEFEVWGKEAPKATIDKSKLENAIAYAGSMLAKSGYSQASRYDLQTALNEGIDVLDNDKATAVEVSKATSKIITATFKLSKSSVVDKTNLIATLQEAKAKNANDYTKASYDTLAAEITNAEIVNKNSKASQEDVLKVEVSLRKAISDLVVKSSADKTKLQSLIVRAEKYVEGRYSNDKWQDMQAKLTEAKRVNDDPSATQNEVNLAHNALLRAVFNLK